jgi:hypothetical protein
VCLRADLDERNEPIEGGLCPVQRGGSDQDDSEVPKGPGGIPRIAQVFYRFQIS